MSFLNCTSKCNTVWVAESMLESLKCDQSKIGEIEHLLREFKEMPLGRLSRKMKRRNES